MSIDEIEKAIAGLPSKERARLRAWFDAFDADKWDEQIDADIEAGKWDKIADEALAEHKAGRSTKL